MSYTTALSYATQISRSESPLLTKLREETRQEIPASQMLSSPLQGRILALFSHLLQPRYIVDIGTYTGYSALCLSEGLIATGYLHTIDCDRRPQAIRQRYFQKSGKGERIISHLGRAQEIIPTLKVPLFDLVFIDADKCGYIGYYKQIVERVRLGGVIIADNVLWKGKVWQQAEREADPRAQALADFATMVASDPRVEQVCLPICDAAHHQKEELSNGLSFSTKRKKKQYVYTNLLLPNHLLYRLDTSFFDSPCYTKHH